MDLTNTLLIILGLVVAIGIVFWVGQRIAAYLASKRSLSVRTRIARDIISASIDQRSTYRLEVQRGEFKGYKAEGQCVQITDMWLVLDMGGAFASDHWDGEEVLVFFQTSFRRKPSFYQFHAVIAGVHKKMHTTILRLPIPPHLDPGQKRSFLRVTPQHGAVLGVGMWPISDTAPLPVSVSKLAPPLLNYRPGKAELLGLDNISAGGMRLTVDKSIDLGSMVDLDKGSHILCLLVLKHMEENKRPLAFWLACCITSAIKEGEHCNYVGTRFTNWALMETGLDQICWFPINKDKSVAPLATWVMRHHLEQNKMA